MSARQRGDMPAHIHALHVALDEAWMRRQTAEERLARVLDENIAEHDRISALIDSAASERARAHGDQDQCFAAIKRLGSYVEETRKPPSYSLADDKAEARTRHHPGGSR